MKKILSILLSLSLLLSVLPAGAESSAVKLEMKTVPIYAYSATPTGIPFPLWFSSDAPDIPFVEVEDWTALLADCQNSMLGRTGYALTVSKGNGPVVIRRETGATVMLDYEYEQINFPDFNVFSLPPASSDLLDTVRAGGFNEKGEAQLFFRVPSDSYTRVGLP